MFEAVLVSFVIQVSGSAPAPGYTVTPFETMEQCEFSKKILNEKMSMWKRGEVETTVIGSTDCYALPKSNKSYSNPSLSSTEEKPIEVDEPVFKMKKHKRWDEQ